MPTASALRVVEMPEWHTRLIEGEQLTATDQRLRDELASGEDGRLTVDELRAGVRIKARSWVGVVRFERFEVRVVPKLAGDNLGLVRMIEFATGIDALSRIANERSLRAEELGLLDLIALLLAESVEDILRGGLLADYVEKEGELPALRGRLLVDRQVLQRLGQLERLVCRFDEQEQNIAENQLLAAALARCARLVRQESVKLRVRRLLAIIQEVCDTDNLDLEGLRGQLTYHRLNEHYRDAHALCWLVLDGLGTEDLLGRGATRCFAFLIDMNRLFELFVYRLVERLTAGEGIRVYYQRGDRSIILDSMTGLPYARVVPDILLETSRPDPLRCAIDAKYKLYDERKLDSGDLYQGFLYSYAYGSAGQAAVPTALLMYPASTTVGRPRSLRVRRAQDSASVEVLTLGIPIPETLAALTQGSPGPAVHRVLEALRYGIKQSSRAVDA